MLHCEFAQVWAGAPEIAQLDSGEIGISWVR